MSTWKHVLVQDSADEDIPPAWLVKNDMPSVFDPAESRMDRIARPSKFRHLSYANKAFNHAVQIKLGLLCTPYIGSVVGNIGEIEFGQG
jgi:hypothetical protein